MKIAVNARFLLPDPLEGVGRYVWETTKSMALAHPEDQFYLFFDRTYDKKYIIADNMIPIVVKPQARHPLLWKLWFDYRLPFYFKKLNIDVFYSGDGYLSLRTDIPTVMVVHDLAYLHFPNHQKPNNLKYLKKHTELFLNKASKLFAVSQFTKDDILSFFALDAKKISVAYNALPEQPEVQEKSQILDFPYFLYMGSIHERKNILKLVQSYIAYRKKNQQSTIKLVLAGRNSWKGNELKKTSEASVFSDYIIFYGSVSETDKHRLYKGANCLVYISVFEGFGIPVLEAFHHGIPVITSQGTSMEEIAADAALLVDPLREDQIVAAFETIQNEKDHIKNLIELGKERLHDFDWNVTANKIYQALKSSKRNHV